MEEIERLQGVTLAELAKRWRRMATSSPAAGVAHALIACAQDLDEAAAALVAQGEPVAWLEPGTLNSCDASIFPALQRDYPDTYRGWFPVYATPPSEG